MDMNAFAGARRNRIDQDQSGICSTLVAEKELRVDGAFSFVQSRVALYVRLSWSLRNLRGDEVSEAAETTFEEDIAAVLLRRSDRFRARDTFFFIGNFARKPVQ
jgi:hypothetical protein